MSINVSKSIRSTEELALLIGILMKNYSGGTKTLVEASKTNSIKAVQEWVDDYLIPDYPKTYRDEWKKVQSAIRSFRSRSTQKTISLPVATVLMLESVVQNNIEVQSLAGAIEWLIESYAEGLGKAIVKPRLPEQKGQFRILKLKIDVYNKLSGLVERGGAPNRSAAVLSLVSLYHDTKG